jgi:all-trans-retinol 13,14-reductase
MKYDVIIIGSGFGGLACGHILSKQGKSVLLLERQAQPGGCIQSYRREGMAFDTGLHYVGGLAEGQTMHRLFDMLGLMRLPWYRLDPKGFDLVTIGGDTFALTEGYENFVDTLAADFPKEREALQRYTDMLRKTHELNLSAADVNDMQSAGAYEWLTKNFQDPLLVNIVSGNALKMELRRESLPLFTFAHGQSSYIQSSWRLKGDGNMIVRSLTDDINRHGGKLVCRAEVEELIEHDGRIVAARCRNGETYEADIFISDVHPTLTFSWIRQSQVLKNMFRRRMASLENTFGMFTASLTIKESTLPYFNHNKFVYTRPNVWTFYDERDQKGDIGGVMISCRVPEDGSTFTRQIDLMTPVPWNECQQWEDSRIFRRSHAYNTWKEETYTRCLALAETVVPGLTDAVESHYTSTPLTYRDYTLTPFGSAYGVRKDYRNLMMTMLSPRTPLPNLLLTGQNIILHGLEGVAMTATHTCKAILG